LFSLRVGRNELCPCGKKSKKCCLADGAIGYSRAERTSARSKLLEYVDAHLGAEDDMALDEFWGPRDNLEGEELDEHFSSMSEQILDDWFMFDRPLETGETVIERFLGAHGARLTRGERAHLQALKSSTVRLYEVEELSPGESLTLVDLMEGGRLTVQEKLGSRSLHRSDWIAARVVVPGASGKPELEGLMEITMFSREGLRQALTKARAAYLAAHPGSSVEPFYRSMHPRLRRRAVAAWYRVLRFRSWRRSGRRAAVTASTSSGPRTQAARAGCSWEP